MNLTEYIVTGHTDVANDVRTLEEWRDMAIAERKRADNEKARADQLVMHLDAVERNIESLAAVKRGLRIDDGLLALESWLEITHINQRLLWRAPTKGSIWKKGQRERLRELENGAE